MILTSLIIICLLSLASDIYLWYRVVRHNASPWRYLHWLPLCIMALLIVMMLTGSMFTWMFSLGIYMFLLAFLPRWLHALMALLRMPRAGLALRIMLIAVSLYGITFGWKRITVRETVVVNHTLPPSFHGFRIAHISDLHLGTYASHPKIVDRIVEMVSEASPDLIVFTGDIVSTSPQELRPFTETLSRLHAPYGIVSILGNHDYCTYGPRKSATEHETLLEEVIAMQRQMGWNLLMNEHIVLRNVTDSIAIVGVENDGHPPFPARANLGKATEGISAGCYKILLTHDPSHWRRAILSHTDIPLTLSGHTHAMHLRICGWSPSALLFSEWGGLYKENNQYLHVNTGTGSNIPFRLGAWPEITIITLTSAGVK
mgnify:CR=1 FL=1